ncbi:MAG: stage II sporulation protein R [Cellulosilyticum sp.]|nr:stage II sporulation protein R [Cellulosilyticum sp.]
MIEILKGEENQHNRLTLLAMIVLGVFLILVSNILIIKSKEETDLLSKQVLRFHVVANSDTTEDQLLKQKVKDEIIEYIEPLMSESKSLDETRKILSEALPEIEKITKETIETWGKDYRVHVTIDEANFPTKSYGDIILPAGEYEACRIIIGEGRGENWWCVMYPPLCYIDAASGVVPLEGKEQLQQELTEEQYKLVESNNQERKYQVKFKIVDTINSIFCKDNYKTKR